MRKILIYSLIFILSIFSLKSQVLDMPLVTQEQDQWCWAGVSKSILDYYGENVQQCEIADYARSVIIWHDFGQTSCCNNPSLGCNYWNYNWGFKGSIQDILNHFGEIDNYGVGKHLTKEEIIEELSNNRPFIIRWGWNSGDGHFIVGHGISEDKIHYMDTWFGEGLKIAKYDWVCYDGEHLWTHTNVLSTSPSSLNTIVKKENTIKVYPNPTNNIINIESSQDLTNSEYEIINNVGQTITKGQIQEYYPVDISNLSKGVYILKIQNSENIFTEKIIKY